ncbi:hypothetical protein BDR26DRAFT_970073 [Obelidium mucronatum]|nr:hypothetical protein BDR26DRAFT_972434 [Obelidium mucronatum]KAI9323901.1 hypothetical protein BDR26DRAFT_970073 [Obelidium mucronatum]
MGILARMRWGALTQSDIDEINATSSQAQSTLSNVPPTLEFFAPVATAMNLERCAVLRKTVMDFAREKQLVCYRIVAKASKDVNTAELSRLGFLNDDATSKIPLTFEFYLGMPVMITKRIPDLEHLKIFANGTLAFVLGFAAASNESFISTTVNGVVVKQFKFMPGWLWVKVRNCNQVLVAGCAPGVVAVPPLTLSVRISLPNSDKSKSITLTQFPAISALACTPEKLQGVTLNHWITIAQLDRANYNPQTLYVAFSRVKTLTSIRLVQKLSMAYSRKFRPPKKFADEMIRLINLVQLPDYTPDHIIHAFHQWKEEQQSFALALP